MDCIETGEVAVARLPDDAIADILSRVPVKSLCRFKCVSKDWYHLIEDRRRGKVLPQTLEGFFYFGGDGGEIHGDGDRDDGGDGDDESGGTGNEAGNGGADKSDVSSSGGAGKSGDSSSGGAGKSDCSSATASGKNLPRRVHAQFINLLGRSMPPPLDHCSFSFLLEQPGTGLWFLSSCNGLVVFGHTRVSEKYNSLGYIVCNPATEEWVSVPSSSWTPLPQDRNERHLDISFTYLIFDPAVSLDFQLVQFWVELNFYGMAGVQTYSSKTGLWTNRTRDWRLQELGVGGQWELWGRDGFISTFAGSVVFNGMLHLVIAHHDPKHEMIVAVDREGKTSRIFRWPENRGLLVFVGQSQGHLHCMSEHEDNDTKKRVLSIWVLEDYDAEEWVLKHVVRLSQLFGTTFSPISLGPFCQSCSVVAIHPNCNSVFFVQYWDGKLISYDMDNMEVCACHILGHGRKTITPYVPYLMESLALAKKDPYMTWEGSMWLKNGIVGISKVKKAIWNFLAPES